MPQDPQGLKTGSFLPQSAVVDVDIIGSMNIDKPLKDFLTRFRQLFNDSSIQVNLKDVGYYSLQQFVNGQLFFPLNPGGPYWPTGLNSDWRQVTRLVVNFGALPNTGVKTVAHGITWIGLPIKPPTIFTRIYATATDTTGKTALPIPYASASGADNIEISVDATNVIITTASNRSNYDVCYVILEFV